MDSRDLVAWNLRKLRVAKGLSQERLGLEAAIARTYVSRLERGLENPTVGVLDRLAKALAVKTVELLKPRVPGERRSPGLVAGRKPPSPRRHSLRR